MRVHFGLHLDGMQPVPPRTALGEVTLGPVRFIEALETELGLPKVALRPGEALLAYRGCLAALDAPERFYHRSFRLDPFAVARTLLGWREQWHQAGWRGSFRGAVSRRLADLAELETHAAAEVPLGIGQRLARIAAALEHARTQISEVVLHDASQTLPRAWQTVLERLPCKPAPGVSSAASARPHTDLGRVQTTLLDLAGELEGLPRPRQTLAGDGSLVVVQGVSRDVSAQALAEYLRASAARDDTLVIAERDGIIVDNALERVGLARAGFQHYSRFRAVTQVLKLCLGLLWEPINPHLLLQFLIHPIAPLPRGVRARLAEAVAAEPGVGGQRWRAALEEIARQQREHLGATEAQIVALREQVRVWLECDRYPAAGAPLDVLIATAQRCAAWLAAMLHTRTDDAPEIDLFAAAEAQAQALIAALAALKAQGHARLKRIELEQLVDEIGSQAPDPATFAEAGHVPAATDPAAATQAWHTVVWWDMSPPSERPSYPWSAAELAELRAEGVALPPLEERIRARTREWLRPIVNARERLILVVHDRDEGQHPLWSQLTSLFDGFTRVHVDEALLAGLPRVPALDIETVPVVPKPLPAPRRWWRLGENDERLQPRAVESYSSLVKLIDYPHEWVLHYAARLRIGRAADLCKGPLLYGNLAHRLFQSFFETHPDWARRDRASVEAWLAERLPELIRQEGAVLCEPGAGMAREWVMVVLEQAFERLLAHLRSAQIVRVRAEHAERAPFGRIELAGTIDLLLEDARGREIVLDVKWGSEDRRGAELAANRHLQLATYAYLRRANGEQQSWPYQAFFIVSTGNVLAQDTSVFPDALVFAAENGEDVVQLWRRAAVTVDWRWRQLVAGRIEVNAAGTAPDAGSQPPAEALPIAEEPDRFDGFAGLTGWEPGA